jgi:hypothetical protein
MLWLLVMLYIFENRVADKWRTCELRLILLSDVFGDMFIEEIGEKLNEAQECLQKVTHNTK